jgi:hypothetical protein
MVLCAYAQINHWRMDCQGDYKYLFLKSGERKEPMADCKRQMLLGRLIEGGRWTTFNRLPKTELQ